MENRVNSLRICVVICTHNPIIEKLRKVIDCIDKNREISDFRLVVIDNASENSTEIKLLCREGTDYLFEGQKGNSYARFRALKLIEDDELLIFVDDDNYLAPNFVEHARQISSKYPELGCFSGRSYPSPYLKVSPWKLGLLPYLGIINRGAEVKFTEATLHWSDLEPIGAGMCLRPEVVAACLKVIGRRSTFFELGRSGKGLLSGEDSFIARQTSTLKMKYGYFPNLKLLHDIKPERLNLVYLVKLLYGYGKSDVFLDRALSTQPSYAYPKNIWECTARYFYVSKVGFYGMVIGFRQFGQFFASKNS
jgi:glycosyltransferase involved in cell wall biosynthesis